MNSKIYVKRNLSRGKEFYEEFRKRSKDGTYHYGYRNVSINYHNWWPDHHHINYTYFQYDKKNVMVFVNVEEKQMISKFRMNIEVFGVNFINDFIGRIYVIEGNVDDQSTKDAIERICEKQTKDLELRIYGERIPRKADKNESAKKEVVA